MKTSKIDSRKITSAELRRIITNKKLTATIDLYNEFHLTKEEKMQTAAAIEAATTEEEIGKAVEKLRKIYDSAYQFSVEDSKWSPGFIRELLKNFENQEGFNPVERLRTPFAIVKAYFEYKAREDELDEVDKDQLEVVERDLPEAMRMIQDIYRELEDIRVIQPIEEE